MAALAPGSVVLTATCEGVSASVRVAVVAETPAPPLEPARPRVVPRRRPLAALGGARCWPECHGARGRRPVADVPPDAAGRSRPGAAPGRPYASGAASGSTPRRRCRASSSPSGPPAGAAARQRRPSLAAEARDPPAGHAMPGASIVWSSSDSTIAMVDRATGRVRAIRPGRVLCVAAASGSGTRQRGDLGAAARRPGAGGRPTSS